MNKSITKYFLIILKKESGRILGYAFGKAEYQTSCGKVVEQKAISSLCKRL
jgi:hypothetical protein